MCFFDFVDKSRVFHEPFIAFRAHEIGECVVSAFFVVQAVVVVVVGLGCGCCAVCGFGSGCWARF